MKRYVGKKVLGIFPRKKERIAVKAIQIQCLLV